MKNSIKTALVAILVTGTIQAQNRDNGLRISEFHIQNGMGFNSMQNYSLSDFQSLAQNSMLLKNDLADFNTNSYYMFNGARGTNGSSYQSLQLGLTFNNKANPLWRIGISHGSSNSFSAGFSKDTYTPYDTLTSSQTGEQFYVDSVHSENYFMDYRSQQLRIESSLIYRTNVEKRWSVYAGIGASLGISYNAHTHISYSTSDYVSSNYSSTYSSNYYDVTEHFRNKMNVSSSVFVPMGIDFRIGKNKEFWKRLHVYYEMKPSLSFLSVPELRTFTSVNMVNSFGLKVTF
jgi:hypothetical protein